MSSLLPKEFMESLYGIEGFDAVAFERVHAGGGQVVSVRLNPMKLPDAGMGYWPGSKGWSDRSGKEIAARTRSTIPWTFFGYYLTGRPSFTFDPLFHAGVYYVQEASSMFLEQVLRQTVDLSLRLKVLDLCAAPGGKSTLIQSLISADSLLVSNEVIRARAAILEENMVKWGGPNVFVTQNDPRDFQRMENYFDVLVVDAPCSGSGLFRREPEAIGEWSVDNVRMCSQRQQRILADCWPALKQGGVLIYSTCSYSKQEDEDILDWLASAFDVDSLPLTLKDEWNIVETAGKKGGYGYRFYPDKLEGEGLFIAALRKKDGGDFVQQENGGLSGRRPQADRSSAGKTGGGKSIAWKLTRQEEQLVKGWIRPEQPIAYFQHHEYVYGLPEALISALSYLQSSCYLKKAGVKLGKPAAAAFIPEHELALSTIIVGGLPTISLSREQAIQYLRKEEIAVEGGHRGWALAQYEGHNLGWMKILANRVNNYYPKEWRILKRDSR